MRLIDANSLIAEMHNVILKDGDDRGLFYKVIERQPTIDPAENGGRWGCQCTMCEQTPVKSGKWRERIVDDEERRVYCSVCGDEYTEQEVDLADWVKDFFNFCPNCGARMDSDG